MELRIPTPEQVRSIYESEMRRAFPAAELKPLSAILDRWRAGRYRPYCLFEGGTALGLCFLWLGNPGWAMIDYLWVASRARNRGLGAELLTRIAQVEPGTVLFGESESPEDAPDPEMARRRLGFYARCGLKTAGYDTEIFGVHYQTLYLAEHTVSDAELMRQHRYIYQSCFSPEKYARHIRIPRDEGCGAALPDAAPVHYKKERSGKK